MHLLTSALFRATVSTALLVPVPGIAFFLATAFVVLAMILDMVGIAATKKGLEL